ncbi:MAG: DUF1667 domain-containing protein [Gracilibacteraceae bacterium]|jgi:CxxC motif-containing protein|nr:DUF1667 domain-containing protein [Gracilibacteraceae bacterium]
MPEKEIPCLICPTGCRLRLVWAEANPAARQINGAGCARGIEYAEQEMTDPRRTLTSTVKVRGGRLPLVSVRSAAPLPRDLLLPAVALLRDLCLDAPVESGRVLLADILGAGTALVTTGAVERASACPPGDRGRSR